jgi:hypothetical protein
LAKKFTLSYFLLAQLEKGQILLNFFRRLLKRPIKEVKKAH